MGQGLEVFNDNYIVQIDGSSPNLVFHTKGSANDSVTFTAPSYPLVFVRPSMGRRMYLRSNGNNSYTYFCTGAFSYWVFCDQVDPAASNFGLQVFSETGGLVYSSHTKPLKIVSVRSYSRAAAWANRYPNSKPSNVTRVVATHEGILPHANFAYAVTFGSGYWALYYYSEYSVEDVPLTEAFQATATGFRVYEVQPFASAVMPLAPYPSSYWSGPPGTIVIADVSGL